MLGAFWQAIGGKLADRWAAISGQSLVFWFAGLVLYLARPGGTGTLRSWTRWLDHQATATQLIVSVAGLLCAAASAIIVAALATPALRLAEGYWPSWAAHLQRRLAAWLAIRAAEEATAWQDAYASVHPPATVTRERLAQYARLERRRRRRPTASAYFMPTPIGNILRAAERRPVDKYGLDTVALWPRLWLLLPDLTRQELMAARASLDNATTVMIWGLLFCAYAPLTLLAIPAGLAVATAALTVVMPSRAQTFGDLVEAAYDLHRTALYQQLRWPLPETPAQERSQGQQLTAYLWRGSDQEVPAFTRIDH